METLGPLCPECRQLPAFVIAGGDQAFCGNDDCRLLCWQPSMTRAEYEALPVHIINLTEA